MKLTAKQKKGIQTWLQLAGQDMSNYCPFPGLKDTPECLTVCPELFPKLQRGDDFARAGRGWCPCQNYTLRHVIRVARKAVE